MSLDIGKAFTFVMEDQKWVAKLAIGGGLILAGIITIVGWLFTFPVVFGYLALMTRNVINGNPQPLPEWENWGELWIEGAKMFVVGLEGVRHLRLTVVYSTRMTPLMRGTEEGRAWSGSRTRATWGMRSGRSSRRT